MIATPEGRPPDDKANIVSLALDIGRTGSLVAMTDFHGRGKAASSPEFQGVC
jgi:hypothetical protein